MRVCMCVCMCRYPQSSSVTSCGRGTSTINTTSVTSWRRTWPSATHTKSASAGGGTTSAVSGHADTHTHACAHTCTLFMLVTPHPTPSSPVPPREGVPAVCEHVHDAHLPEPGLLRGDHLLPRARGVCVSPGHHPTPCGLPLLCHRGPMW